MYMQDCKERNPKGPSPQQVILKLNVATQERILKFVEEKITLEGIPVRLIANFSTETSYISKEKNDTCQILTKKLPMNTLPVRLSFTNEGKIMTSKN